MASLCRGASQTSSGPLRHCVTPPLPHGRLDKVWFLSLLHCGEGNKCRNKNDEGACVVLKFRQVLSARPQVFEVQLSSDWISLCLHRCSLFDFKFISKILLTNLFIVLYCLSRMSRLWLRTLYGRSSFCSGIFLDWNAEHIRNRSRLHPLSLKFWGTSFPQQENFAELQPQVCRSGFKHKRIWLFCTPFFFQREA